MNIASAIFDRSAPDLESCPDESLPEFAFIGRSNVGKSSLLNMLSGQRTLARVSPTPGFTKLINFFTMNKTWRLVDLPGYGYAKVARKDQSKFNRAVADYLQHRPNLCCVFALLDAGLPPQANDLEFVEWLAANSIPFVLVFTKIDQIKPGIAQANREAFAEAISAWCEDVPEIFSCAATTGQGKRELLGVIDEALVQFQGDSAQGAHDPTLPGEESPGARRRARADNVQSNRPNPARPW